MVRLSSKGVAAPRPLPASQAIRLVQRPVFTTREIAAIRKGSPSGTTQALSRLATEGALLRVKRGLWCDPNDRRFTPFALVPFLAREQRAYVSFLSALHLHGVIEQIPQAIFAATTGHTRLIQTPLGVFSFHQIDPDFFDGFDWYGESHQFLVATREKALIDCLYLASRKGSRFRYLPELDLGKPFSIRAAREWVDRIGDSRIRAFVAARFREIYAARGGSRSRS